MKKTLLMLAVLVMTFVSACTNEDDMLLSSPSESVKIGHVLVKNGQIVKSTRTDVTEGLTQAMWFKDEKIFSTYYKSLEDMPDSIKPIYPNGMGIELLYNLERYADLELDSIDTAASSEKEFLNLYNDLIKKYSDKLITNYIDKTDLSLYAPIGENENIKFIANKNGEYVIGNKVFKISDKMLPHSVQVLSALEAANNKSEGDYNELNNLIYKPVKGRRISFSIERKDNKVTVYMKAKRKAWYGWKADNSRWLVFEPILQNFKSRLSVDKNIYWFFHFSEVKDYIGDGLLWHQPLAHDPKVTGTVYVWSDYELTKDKDGSVLTDSKRIPVTDRNKAKIVKVSLPGEH